jgi:hypothetical protein
MPLYFVYDDLLDRDTLRTRLGILPGGDVPAPIAPAMLPKHKLLFRKSTAAGAEAFADLVEDPYATVYGALFNLTQPQVDLLAPAAGNAVYRSKSYTVIPYLPQRGPIQVDGAVVRHEQEIEATLREGVSKAAAPTQPTRQQVKTILNGALAAELPLRWSRSLINGFATASCIDDIVIGKSDGAGEPITKVHTKVPPLYAVYETDRVKVQYADDIDRANAQRKNMADLNELRGQIAGLIDGWQTAGRRRWRWPRALRGGAARDIAQDTANDAAQDAADSKAHDAARSDGKPDRRVKKFNARVAAGLVMCLEDDEKGAHATLQGVHDDILADRQSLGRYQYLTGAFITSAVIVALFYLFRHAHWNQFYRFPTDTTQLMLAARAGAVGAFFRWRWA